MLKNCSDGRLLDTLAKTRAARGDSARESLSSRSSMVWMVGLLLFVSALGAQSDESRVLLIGNSFTYYNNMPAMLEAIAAANEGGPRITAEMHVEGGRELSEAVELSDLRKMVSKGGWDFVVLQGQSRLGNTNFVNGHNVIDDPEPFFTAVREWVRLIRQSGAAPLLLSTWLEADEKAQREWDMIGWAYREIGRELSVPVVGADLAWQRLASSFPDLELYAGDGLHPSPLGSLLVAALLYEEISGAGGVTEDELPSRIEVDRVEEDDGTAHTGELVEVGAFSPLEIEAVRAVVQANRTTSVDLMRPSPPHYPQFSDLSGEASVPTDFAGRWQGEAKHYPDFLPWPGMMTLELNLNAEGRVSGHMSISFEGSQFTVSVQLDEVVVENDRLVFEDPDGPESSIVRYEGVLTPTGHLAGLASLIGEDSSLRMVGEWRLVRAE